MVKYTQTICQQFADELFESVWPFCGLALKGLILSELINSIPPEIIRKTYGFCWFQGG